VLDSCGQQPAGAAHHGPVVFESLPTGQTYLIVTALVVDAWPGETVRATLSKKLSQEVHRVTGQSLIYSAASLPVGEAMAEEVVGRFSVNGLQNIFKLRMDRRAAVTANFREKKPLA
jgi:hypothetical protein